jgi:flagellar biosynthesis protein FlhB
MHNYLAAQIVGAVAVLLSLAVYQFNNRRAMLALSMLGALSWAIHFFMLSAMTGAAMNLIATGWCFVFLRIKPNRSNLWILFSFLALDSLATYLTWQGSISLLAMSGSMLTAIAFWSKSTKVIRRLALSAPPLWFTYNLMAGSYPGMFFEVFTFTSNLVGQYRFDVRPKKKFARRSV